MIDTAQKENLKELQAGAQNQTRASIRSVWMEIEFRQIIIRSHMPKFFSHFQTSVSEDLPN